MRLTTAAFMVIATSFTLLGCRGNETAVPASASSETQSAAESASATSVGERSTDTSPPLPFPHNFDLLTKEQARQWAIGSWILDYGAKLEHARSDEERTALESERRDRIASLELRADGTFTTSNRLANSPTDTTMVGKWTVKFPYELAGESETGEMLRFSLQPNGFLLQLTATETGYKEDYWKKIR